MKKKYQRESDRHAREQELVWRDLSSRRTKTKDELLRKVIQRSPSSPETTLDLVVGAVWQVRQHPEHVR